MKRYRRKNTKEYPLYGFYNFCPHTRYVGGISGHLCECKNPNACLGVILVQAKQKKES